MKLNNILSYVLGAGLFFGAVGCTDEVSYTPAEKFEGENVYFTSASSSVSLPENATEFEVALQRADSKGDVTVKLASTVVDDLGADMSGIFTVPETVTFTGDATTANVKVAVDFANVVADTRYTINIKIDGADVTPYGPVETAVSVVYSPWSPMKRIGAKDDYAVVTVSILGAESPVAAYMSESLIRPEAMYQFGDYDCPDLNDDDESWTYVASGMNYEVTLNKTNNYVYLTPTPIAKFNVTGLGERIGWITDIYTYVSEINPQYIANSGYTAEDFKGASTFDPVTGLFAIETICYVPEGVLEDTYDYIQLPGYAHYEVDFKVLGNFVSSTGDEMVIVNAYKSEDLYSYTYEVYPGTLSEAEVAQKVAEIQNNAEAKLYTETTQDIQLTLPEEGPYTIVVVGYDEGGNKIYDSFFNFTFKTVQSSSEWKSVGTCLYTDDYIASAFKNLGGDTWEVAVEENINTPGFYRLVNPYYSWLESLNGAELYMPGDYYLYVNASDPDGVYIPESPLGFALSDEDGGIIAYSMAAMYLEKGNSLEAIKQAGYCGQLKEGVITFPVKTLLIGFENLDSWYYANANGMFEIDMTDVLASAPRKANAKGNIHSASKNVKESAEARVAHKIYSKVVKNQNNGKFNLRNSK